MKIGFMRSCFGCCGLRTGVIIITIIDLIFGMYDIIEFSVSVFLDFSQHSHHYYTNGTEIVIATRKVLNGSIITKNASLTHFTHHHGEIYDDSAFAQIVVGCIDILISAFLLYVAAFRKYDYRVAVFIAAIWSFVFSFLNMVSFAVFIALHMVMEMLFVLIAALLELFFGYIILSYFKFMTVVVERGLDDMRMSYFPEEVRTDTWQVQMGDANDERPIMDDQDDFPAYEMKLVT